MSGKSADEILNKVHTTGSGTSGKSGDEIINKIYDSTNMVLALTPEASNGKLAVSPE